MGSLNQLLGGRQFPEGYKEERGDLSQIKNMLKKEIAKIDFLIEKFKLEQKDKEEKIILAEKEIERIKENIDGTKKIMEEVCDVLEGKKDSLPPDILILVDKVFAHKEEFF